MTVNSNQPLVSIGIPTYNRANGNLHNVIVRALEQTYENVEVIVSDNCSTDNTSDVVQTIEDDRLKYIRHETNIGAINNFNHCLEVAKGEYFLLLHDDDMIDIDFIEACISALKPGQIVGTIFTGIRLIGTDNEVLEEHENEAAGLSSVDFVRGWYKGDISLYLPSTLYNTTFLKEVGGFRSRKNMYPDLIATFKLVAKYDRIDINTIKASFRRHAGTLGSTFSIKNWVDDALYVLETLCELFPDDCVVLKKEGDFFYSSTMYKRVTRWPKPTVLERWADLFLIYRSFDFCCSPFKFYYGKNTGRRIWTKIAKLLGSRG